MSTFLYYIPGQSENIDPRQLKLPHAFEQKPMGRRVVDRGPDGGSGSVFVASGADLSKLGHWPDKQTWTDVPILGCWVGYYPADPPREEHLRRSRMLTGKTLLLSGQEWTIPMARSFQQLPSGQWSPVSNLASYLKVDYSTGEWKSGDVATEYQPLWDLAMRYWELWWKTQVGEADDAEIEEVKALDIGPHEIEDMAVQVLATNYRVGKVEVSLMSLLTTEDCFAVLNAAIDLESFFEIIKKNHSRGESSSSGNGKLAGSPTIPQPSPTG